MSVDTKTVQGEGQLKLDRHRSFGVFCDEPDRIGDQNSHPRPLFYIAMGLGFWLLTQITRYAHMMKFFFKRASCKVNFDYFLRGSVLERMVESGCTSVRTCFVVESNEPRENVAGLIRNAKKGCFAESMVQEEVPLISTIELDEKPLSLEEITDG